MTTTSDETLAMAVNPTVEESHENTIDFDFTNLLYVQNLPNAPAQYQASLQGDVKSINLWLAWELTKVEQAVKEKVKVKADGTSALPSDDSLLSKYKRTSYRAKVVDAYRKQSPWLATSGVFTSSVKLTATEDKINAAILHAVLGVGELPKNPQVLNGVKTLGYGGHDTLGLVQPYVMYIVDHQLDQVRQTSEAIVKTISFNITVTEVQAPVEKPSKDPKDPKDTKGTENSKDTGDIKATKDTDDTKVTKVTKSTKPAKPAKEKTYEATVNYIVTAANFNFDLWNNSMSKDEEDYALGKQILDQKELTLMAPST